MEGAPAEPAVVSQAEPPRQHSWLTSPWLILLLLGLLVLVAVPVAMYLWLNSEGEDDPAVAVPPVAQTRSAIVAASAPAVEPAPASSAPPAGGAAAIAEPTEAETPATPPAGSVLHLEFGEESWVEIRDAGGRLLHRQLNQPGTSTDVQGRPPFDVLIGNAAQTRMTYNGRPIDLKPFTAVAVARFTLEE
jgi:cytoskeleton protein RodZ